MGVLIALLIVAFNLTNLICLCRKDNSHWQGTQDCGLKRQNGVLLIWDTTPLAAKTSEGSVRELTVLCISEERKSCPTWGLVVNGIHLLLLLAQWLEASSAGVRTRCAVWDYLWPSRGAWSGVGHSSHVANQVKKQQPWTKLPTNSF